MGFCQGEGDREGAAGGQENMDKVKTCDWICVVPKVLVCWW